MPQQYAVVFPGQGSQSVGMLSELHEQHAEVRDTFAEASDALTFDLWQLVSQGPAETLNQTHNTQPAMLAAGIACWKLINASLATPPSIMAGHSLGEYTALVAAGAMDFADAIRLVAERGRLMQEAVPEGEGAMAAILGLEDDAVQQLCSEAAPGQSGQVVEAVNFNSPGQVVIAGNREAVERAIDLARQAGAKRALPLPVSAPSHCALMKPAAEKLAVSLQSVQLSLPAIPVLHNVSVSQADSTQQLAGLLAQQLYRPVRWVETIEEISRLDIKNVVESGPGKVLTGLCKRIDKSVTGLAVYDAASLASLVEKLHA